MSPVLDPGCVKTLRGIIAPGILGSVRMRRAKKRKNLSSARHFDRRDRVERALVNCSDSPRPIVSYCNRARVIVAAGFIVSAMGWLAKDDQALCARRQR